jgi:hypothetical protein
MKSESKYFVFVMVMLCMQLTLFAQDEEQKEPEYGWKKKVVGNLNLTQNQFDNWATGGENSWSWQLDLLADFTEDQENYNWANSGKLSYGKVKLGEQDARKAADEIKLESVFSYKLNEILNPYVSLTALTQFTTGYNYGVEPNVQISNFMDPGYFTQGLGMLYKPGEALKTRLGASIKETVTDEYADLYALGDKFRVEVGAESVTDLSVKMSELILFTSKIQLFSTLKRFDEIDVDWDNIFSAKISEYINVSLNIRLFYDKDITPKRQLKQTLAVGLSYNFI